MAAPHQTMPQTTADAVMPTYGRIDLCFVRGEGSYLYTEDDSAYLDCASGIAVTTLGHNHEGLRAALHDQIDKLWHTSNLFRIAGQEKLAARLAQAANLDQVFFCNSGAEANEAAVKMARRFHYRAGHEERVRIICAGGAFHGQSGWKHFRNRARHLHGALQRHRAQRPQGSSGAAEQRRRPHRRRCGYCDG